jgi:transcriptional antiterminator NusG
MLEVPLFPGYLFVHSDLRDFDYYHVLRQDGVVSILGIKGQYTPVPEDTVDSIRTLVSSRQPIFPWSRFVPGKRVRVLDGPLAGASGVILRLKKGKSRLVVGVELLGRSVCAELAENSVEIDR